MEEYEKEARLIPREAEKMERSEYGAGQEISRARKKEIQDAQNRPMLLVQPTLACEAGAQILWLVAHSKEKLPISLYLEFNDMCIEWEYVIDLDHEILEVYAGIKKND